MCTTPECIYLYSEEKLKNNTSSMFHLRNNVQRAGYYCEIDPDRVMHPKVVL